MVKIIPSVKKWREMQSEYSGVRLELHARKKGRKIDFSDSRVYGKSKSAISYVKNKYKLNDSDASAIREFVNMINAVGKKVLTPRYQDVETFTKKIQGRLV